MIGPTYHKINSLYKRDDKGVLLPGQWSTDELAYLAELEWIWTEKVDGTNIRITVDADGSTEVGGRTDRAQIPAPLLAAIEDLLARAPIADAFPNGATLYGEGYGPKIQKGGGNYRDDPSFVLFDVLVDGWWLLPDAVTAVGERLGLDVVPVVGRGSLADAEALVARGLRSTWGDFEAEGVVCRPAVPMFSRAGHRVITKIKAKDLRRLAVAGCDR
ncbi:MAG: RNA ligase family protein [Myxococcota bacterium]